MPDEVRVLAATGMLGTGFAESSLELGMQRQPHVIGCDAGSTDPGPFYLGSGRMQAAHAAVKRDLRLILRAGRAANVPVIIGSAGTAGGEPHLALTRDIVEEIAREDGLSFTLALIHAELEPAFLKERLRCGRIHPLKPAPAFDEDSIDRAVRFVGQMAAEPFMQALEQGADVILAGRASDTSIYAAYPLMQGSAPGPVWHAAKILECGAASVTQRLHPDPLLAWIHRDDFVVEPPHPKMRCTPNSVVAHTLYENADPFRLYEPAGLLDTSAAEYVAVSDRAVRVTGSRFVPAERYTVRIEGAEYVGHRYAVIAGVRDPVVLRRHDDFLAGLRSTIAAKAEASLGLTIDRDFRLVFRVYGQSGSMGALEPDNRIEGHEIGLVVEAIGRTAEQARAVITVAWHTGLHHPVPEWEGLISNWAFPYSPPEMDCGPVYRFCVNHVVELDDPCEVFPIEYVQVGKPALAAV
jgi:hypothetical protein